MGVLLLFVGILILLSVSLSYIFTISTSLGIIVLGSVFAGLGLLFIFIDEDE